MTTKQRFSDLLSPDIDHYLNLVIPPNRLGSLPKPFRHFFGFRSEPHVEPPFIFQWIISFIATVGGLCLVGGVFNYAPAIVALNPPMVIASLGASAVLDYNTIRSPLAQPRNNILGQTFSAIMGVAIAKLFRLAPDFFTQYAWVSGAVGCACASLVMSMTNTVHPPGGATAVLASTEASIVLIGWWFVPLVLLGSILMLCVALLFNNLLRQYPVYWWTPSDVGSKLRRARREEAAARRSSSSVAIGGDHASHLEKQISEPDSERTLRHEFSNNVDFVPEAQEVRLLPYKIQLPGHIEISPEEIKVLQNLQERMRTHGEVGG
jgi:hypothetical protein